MPLQRFHAILKGQDRPAYLHAKELRLNIDISPETPTEELWAVHDTTLSGSTEYLNEKGPTSLLDLKLELAWRLLESCTLCENRCKVNRLSGERGFCGVDETRVDTVFLHFGEEPPIVPSLTVFFTGCSFKCVFCQNHSISQHPHKGRKIHPEEMAELIAGGGGTNVNWVGGDPGPHLAYILEVLNNSNTHKPQLWNSNLYQSPEAMKLLQGVVDVFLSDFKYGNGACASRLSKVDNYWEVTTRNHLLGQEEVFVGENKVKADFIIRHLVLPNHYLCCSVPVINWLKENMEDPYINVMAQYHPQYKAHEHEDIGGRVDMLEFRRLERLARG
jgi:putative pyruvate formate lyase activating enzyme